MTRATRHTVSESALLFTSPPWPASHGTVLDSQTILDPLLGRSLLQRAVEHLVRLGARHLMVVLGDNASEVRDFLKTGERWGCRISYHYPDPQAPMRHFLKAIGITDLEHYRVGNAWSLASLAIDANPPARGAGRALYWQDAGASRWTGWGCLSGAWLLSRNVPTDPAALGTNLAEDERLEKSFVMPELVADTPGNLITSVKRLLDEGDAAVRKAARAQIHPSARLIAPCYIGKAVSIDAGAVVGPHAVVEDGAYIAAGAQVRHSVVMPETYVGAELELDHVIARGPVLVNAVLGIRTEISDPQLLDHLYPAPRHARWSSRVIAAALQSALFPMYLLLRWRLHHFADFLANHAIIPSPGRQAGSLRSMRVAFALPAPGSSGATYDWPSHFLATFYPGLGSVRRGELRFIGPSLRSWRETAKLPGEWRRIYEKCPCGLLNDAWMQANPGLGGDESFASDALAAAGPDSPRLVIRHVLPYLRRVWQGAFDGGMSRSSPSTRASAV